MQRPVSEHDLTGCGPEVTLGETIRLTSRRRGRGGNGTLPIRHQSGQRRFGGVAVALSGQVDDGGGAERLGGDGARACWGSSVRAARSRDGNGRGREESRKCGNFFDFRAAFVEPPQSGSTMPAVRITFPDGTIATAGRTISSRRCRGRWGARSRSRRRSCAPRVRRRRRYWPDMEGLDHRDTVTDVELPEGTSSILRSCTC